MLTSSGAPSKINFLVTSWKVRNSASLAGCSKFSSRNLNLDVHGEREEKNTYRYHQGPWDGNGSLVCGGRHNSFIDTSPVTDQLEKHKECGQHQATHARNIASCSIHNPRSRLAHVFVGGSSRKHICLLSLTETSTPACN